MLQITYSYHTVNWSCHIAWKRLVVIHSDSDIKGKVHPKMILSTHSHADGRLGEVFLVHKTMLEFHREKALQYSPKQLKLMVTNFQT